METQIFKDIRAKLEAAKRPVFVSDRRTDGDSLGAALGLADWMRGRGVPVPVYVSGPVPPKYLSLPHADLCTYDPEIFRDASIDLIVVFDCSEAAYVREILDRCPGRPTVINIDHHDTNPRYGHLNQVIVDSPATAEVVLRFYKVNNIIPSCDAAVCLLTGICFDTSGFVNGATDRRAFAAAAELRQYGAKPSEVMRALSSNMTVSALHMWGTALERVQEVPEHGLVLTTIRRADLDMHGVTDEEVDGLSNFLSLVVDAPVVAVMREHKDGGVKISMRSQVRNVAEVAKSFGGGGHMRAAGFHLKEAVLESAHEQLLSRFHLATPLPKEA